MLLGLGWPEWLLIIGLIAGLLLTFKVMTRAAASYERARRMREAREQQESIGEANEAAPARNRGEEPS